VHLHYIVCVLVGITLLPLGIKKVDRQTLSTTKVSTQYTYVSKAMNQGHLLVPW